MPRYQISTFTSIQIPVNVYVPISYKDKVNFILEYYGLYKYYSPEYIYVIWKTFSNACLEEPLAEDKIFITEDGTWATPSKERIEFVFRIKLKEI